LPEDTLDGETRQLIEAVNYWLDIPDALEPGERVVTGGVVEMTAALEDLKAKAKSKGGGVNDQTALKD
jgi:hypothetical protein